MTFNSFLKKVDSTLQGQYSLEKFKDGKTGKGSGLTYQEHLKRRPQPQPNIWIVGKYKENFIMPKPLDGSLME